MASKAVATMAVMVASDRVTAEQGMACARVDVMADYWWITKTGFGRRAVGGFLVRDGRGISTHFRVPEHCGRERVSEFFFGFRIYKHTHTNTH